MLPWQTVEAKMRSEALEKSPWQIGDLGKCIAVDVIRTEKGTYAILPTFVPTFEKLKRPEVPETLDPSNGACGK
jgi:hypothetical protein